MSVWLVRAGRYGEGEYLALEKGLAVISWGELLNAATSSENTIFIGGDVP